MHDTLRVCNKCSLISQSEKNVKSKKENCDSIIQPKKIYHFFFRTVPMGNSNPYHHNRDRHTLMRMYLSKAVFNSLVVFPLSGRMCKVRVQKRAESSWDCRRGKNALVFFLNGSSEFCPG